MNRLPLDLIHEILFKLEPKSLAIMGCTNKYFKSHIFEDPWFEFNYSYPVGSSFILNLSGLIACISSGRSTNRLLKGCCHILDSSSGLVLLIIGGRLVVINPLTKKFRLIDHSGSKHLAKGKTPRSFGFLAERTRTTKRFKIVGIIETFDTYEFEIYDGDTWRSSKMTITPGSKSDISLRKSVYLDGTFHWLRHDGSIIAFNLEKEQAYLIPSSFQESLIPDKFFRELFAADDKINRLTCIFWGGEGISIYTLENSKWSLARKIKNKSMEETEPAGYREIVWEVVAYDGKQLVVQELSLIGEVCMNVHVYDMEANSWDVLGSCEWGINGLYGSWVYHKFTPALFSVENEHYFKEIVASEDKYMSNLADIIGFINKNSCIS